MVDDGTWIFVYRGAIGTGLGFFEIRSGRARGCDWGGIKYTARVTEIEENGELQFDVTMDVPANLWHASGASALEVPSTRTRVIRLPRTFDDGTPHTFNMTPGPITVMFFRVPEERAPMVVPFLSGFKIVPVG